MNKLRIIIGAVIFIGIILAALPAILPLLRQ
jgi:hypothetical protein